MTAPSALVATYRLQLTPHFGFARAAGVVSYLADLGVSHLYLSPIFEARPGSTHGYDQTDPMKIREELGGESQFVHLADAARSAGLGIILDIVPNHMAAHHLNPWWCALLRDGHGSEFDRFFDVDWAAAADKIVLPVLGAPLDQCIADGHLSIDAASNIGPALRYFDRLFPLRHSAPAARHANLAHAIADQHYELAFWRDGLPRINYRRFFDIADLAALRIEDDAVFHAVHARIFDLVSRGMVHAIRVDHIDGLRDPRTYLERLHSGLTKAAGQSVPIFVEKILAHDESLPPDWPVAGTTGYEFLAAAAQLATEPTGFIELRRHAGVSQPFRNLAVACKREAAETILEPELKRLCRSVESCLAFAGHPLSPPAIREAIINITSHLDAYRTYADARGLSQSDLERIHRAGQHAAEPVATPVLLNLLTLSGPFSNEPHRAQAIDVIQNWQQFSGPLAAKGVEDAALYRDTSCPWLCDVGAEPHMLEVDAVVRSLSHVRASHPLSLNATDTHDAKRSEDVRATLAALSHQPAPWMAVLKDALARSESTGVSRTDMTLLMHSAYAILTSTTTDDAAPRLKAYMIKAAREAKVNTNWLSPNLHYESSLEQAIALLFSPEWADIRTKLNSLHLTLHARAIRTSIAQCILKCLFPGIPDLYQGAEFPIFSLVDPDNRRPVDFHRRSALLEHVRSAWQARNPQPLADPAALKLFAIWRSMAIRRRLLTQGALSLATSQFTASTWSWTIAAAEIRCTIQILLDATAKPKLPDAGTDQLAGLVQSEGRSWVTIVVKQESELW